MKRRMKEGKKKCVNGFYLETDKQELIYVRMMQLFIFLKKVCVRVLFIN